MTTALLILDLLVTLGAVLIVTLGAVVVVSLIAEIWRDR